MGLHPITAIAMVTVDVILFASDLTGIGWTISIIVAIVLMIPCVLLQYYLFADALPVAIAKGVVVGLLTAIPTPLPSILTVSSGIAGFVSLKKLKKENNQVVINSN